VLFVFKVKGNLENNKRSVQKGQKGLFSLYIV